MGPKVATRARDNAWLAQPFPCSCSYATRYMARLCGCDRWRTLIRTRTMWSVRLWDYTHEASIIIPF
jgi:hypothetical protein